MKIRTVRFHGRQAWEMDNGLLSVTMTVGGGHIACLHLCEGPKMSPLWVPPWESVEPWQYRQPRKLVVGQRVLASILGHNLCLGWFGAPSQDEFQQGLECHGEASIARWRFIGKHVTNQKLSMTCECVLPVAQMRLIRTLTVWKNSNVVDVQEQVQSMSRRDQPFTMCEHVTLGPPFLEKGVTVFDMPATRCHTFPDKFKEKQRVKTNTAFTWPKGPGINGRPVDLRMIGKAYKASSDFTTQLMDVRRPDAWFSALNPKVGLLLAYVWRRADFPWVGNWEENYARQFKPWLGRTLTRGMEFSNTPFPGSLRKVVTMGQFHHLPTYRWLPAKGKVEMKYSIILQSAPADAKGVKNIRRTGRNFKIELK